MKKISIIIPTFNRRNLLPVAISSVLNQDCDLEVECVVVNDAGCDVQDIIDSFHDRRLKYVVHSNNAGLGAARNTGIANSTGDLLGLLDDDDALMPLHSRILSEVMERKNQPIVYANCVCAIYENIGGQYQLRGKQIPWDKDYDHDGLLLENINPVLGFMFDRKLLDGGIKFNEEVNTLEDWMFWVELAEKHPLYHVKVATSEYRWHMDGSTMSSSRKFEETFPIAYKHNYPFAHDKWNVGRIMNQVLIGKGQKPIDLN